MILQNSRISARQVNRLILAAGTGTLMMLLPDAAGNQETGIAALFVSFVITLVHLKIVFWLVRKSDSRTEKSFHIIISLAAIIEFVKCTALSTGLLLAAANTVRTILLPGKSFALVAAVWLAGAVYLACAGTEARGRFGEAVWLIAILPPVVLLLLCLAHIGKHGSITEEALISGEILKNNAVGILLRGILYSAVFAPVELIYWCRDKIAWEVTANHLSKTHDSATDSLTQDLSEREAANGESMERKREAANGESVERKRDDAYSESVERKREAAYRKTENSILLAICIVFIFAILFTAAAVGILGIQGIQATEHSALAIAAGLDVMGAVVAQKQGIAVLFFLTGMLTSSGVLLGQMKSFAEKAVRVIADRKRYPIHNENVGSGKGGGNGKRNHVISLGLALLIWCVAAGFYGRFVNSAAGEQTAGNTGAAGSGSTAENADFAGSGEGTEKNGTATASLNTTAQIEDRAYCTAIGIDLAEVFENAQLDSMEIEEEEEEKETGGGDSGRSNSKIWNDNGDACYLFNLEIAQGSDMEASLVTCTADSLDEAVAIFNANSDRELDVSHLQILLMGNSLLENECYKTILLEFGDAAESYFGGTLLAFTSETALEYMENYANCYDSQGAAVGIHLKKRFEQGLESEKAVLGTVYYRWINHREEEPAEWIPTLS